jgi:hypothetical protein
LKIEVCYPILALFRQEGQIKADEGIKAINHLDQEWRQCALEFRHAFRGRLQVSEIPLLGLNLPADQGVIGLEPTDFAQEVRILLDWVGGLLLGKKCDRTKGYKGNP